MEYHRQVAPGFYAPPAPPTDSSPLQLSSLPGGVAVLDHVWALAESQDGALSGGSFLPFIKGTLELCSQHRQPSTASPRVRTLVFPTSTDAEIVAFIRDFNAQVAESASPASGFLPHSFYHLDVECVSKYAECAFKIIPRGQEEIHIWSNNLPARIHFGFHTVRYDIVIPWTALKLSSNHQGAYHLRIPSLQVSQLWYELFAKLDGIGIGIGLKADVEQVAAFWSHFFPRDRFDPVQIKTADLEVLLAFAGFNSNRTNITALNFFFTGGFIVKHWEMRCGFGTWGSLPPLPPALNLYLQSEAIGVLNTALVCLCTILLHWFVTPGIAAVVSRKTPDKFLGWFTRFWSCVLGRYTVSTADQFCNSEDRATSPKRMLRGLVASRGSPVFPASSLADCLPPWRSVTGGGSPSDQLTIDHLLTAFYPLLCGQGVPNHLRWKSDFRLATGFLSGKPTPSARRWSTQLLGCHPDTSLLEVPVLPLPTSGTLAPLRAELTKFRASLPREDPAKLLSLSQLLLSYAWQHPEQIFLLFRAQVLQERKHFTQRDFDLVRPLVLAYFPEAASLDGPPAYNRFRAEKLLKGDLGRLEALQRALNCASSKADRARLRRKIRGLRRTMSKLEKTVAPDASVLSPLQAQASPAPATPIVSPASPTPAEAGPDSDETRMVVYRETTPGSDSDELVVSTADWDQL